MLFKFSLKAFQIKKPCQSHFRVIAFCSYNDLFLKKKKKQTIQKKNLLNQTLSDITRRLFCFYHNSFLFLLRSLLHFICYMKVFIYIKNIGLQWIMSQCCCLSHFHWSECREVTWKFVYVLCRKQKFRFFSYYS